MQCTVFYWFVWVVSVCLVAAIEVHENPNEENTTTDSGMLKSTLPNSSVATVGSGANNEPGKQHVTASGTPASNGGNSEDYTIVPSNHKPATNNNQPKHSPSYRDAPLSITPTVSSLASSTSSSPQSASAVATQSSSSGSSSKNSGAAKDVAGGSNLVQHQISGYKKRQLYAGSYQQLTRNATNDRSYDKDNQAPSKEFVPSPELVPYYPSEENQQLHHHHHQHSHSHQYQQHAIHQVDAPYPASVVTSDSKWFGGNYAPGGPVDNELRSGVSKPAAGGPGWPSTANKWEQHPKSGKLLWLPNGNGGGEQDSPFSRPKPKLNPPKGKWKWVPVEEEGGSDGGDGDDSLQQGEKAPADLESKIVAGHHHFYKFPPREHPYSFVGGGEDGGGTTGQSPFSGGGSTSDEAPAGNTASNPLDFFYSTAFGEAGGVSTKLKTGGKGGDADSLKKGGVSPWKKIIHVLTAAIPIGLIISALTPQVVYVNPNMTLPPVQMQTPTPISATGGSFTNPTRQRSEDQLGGGDNPLVGFISALSANPIAERWPSSTGCEERSFCEMARLGRNTGADALLRMLWKTANETPSDRARQSGLDEIFRAVRDDDCLRFHCEAT